MSTKITKQEFDDLKELAAKLREKVNDLYADAPLGSNNDKALGYINGQMSMIWAQLDAVEVETGS